MPKTLFLFPDTNIFVQCLPLDQVDWSIWSNFDEVRLIVSRPVQGEIDKHKNKGSDRLAKHARTASALLREIINSTEGHKIVRMSGPVVKLELRLELRPAPALNDRLDYDEVDDRLVGIAYAFAEQEKADVRVLTHDIGPIGSAKMVGLPFVEVPDSWLLPPETREVDKKAQALEKELEKLRKTEPAFRIECRDVEAHEVDVFHADLVRHPALNEEQVSELLRRLEEGLPMVADFGPKEAPARKPSPTTSAGPFGAVAANVWKLADTMGGIHEEWVAASEKDIAKYRETYPKWLSDCGQILRTLHQLLDQRAPVPLLWFWAVNQGTRPARDVLVSIEAKGNFLILPPPNRSGEDDEQKPAGKKALELPAAPVAPRGRWQQKTYGLLDSSMLNRGLGIPSWPIDSLLSHIPRPNDPNAFYWKSKPPIPSSNLKLECKQWRHAIDPEGFEFEIHSLATEGEIRASLEFWIRAENLSEPAFKRVPVRIAIRQADTYEIAQQLVARRIGWRRVLPRDAAHP